LLKVFRQRALETQRALIVRMRKAESGSVQKDARRSEQRADESLGIHALAQEGMARLRQMDPDLVGAPRFKRTRDERAVAQLLQHVHVGDGLATLSRKTRAPAEAVAAIAHQYAFYRLRTRLSVNDS
jgi:hypothetical protein